MKTRMRMREKLILRVVSRAFIPFILLFASMCNFTGTLVWRAFRLASFLRLASFYGLIFGLARKKWPHRPPWKSLWRSGWCSTPARAS